jgi:hypothetical protein
MKEIILTIVVGLLLTIAGLFIEKCYFEESSCPVNSMNTIASETPRGVKKELISNFKISYLYRPAGQGEAQPLGKTALKRSVLKTGDDYKIIFQPPAKKYVYIFLIDSANRIFRLFPTTDFANADKKNKNPVKQGKKYFVPAKKWSFKLDATTGKETIYTIVSDKPDKNLEQQYETMLAQQDNLTPKQRKATRKKWHKTMKKRGIKNKFAKDGSTLIKWQEQGQKLSTTLLRLRNMCDGCVNIVSFKHE